MGCKIALQPMCSASFALRNDMAWNQKPLKHGLVNASLIQVETSLQILPPSVVMIISPCLIVKCSECCLYCTHVHVIVFGKAQF